MNQIGVLQTGGKQYLVKAGQVLRVEKLDSEKKSLEFPDLLHGKKIQASIVGEGKGKKVRIFKFHPKTRYKRTKGHRQLYTELKIEKID